MSGSARRPSYLEVGRIAGTHGLNGDIKVYPTTDFPLLRFRKGSKLLLSQGRYEDGPLEPAREVKVQGVRETNPFFLVKLDVVSDRESAQKLRGLSLIVSSSDVPDLGEDTFLVDDLLGCEVFLVSGERVGEVVDVILGGPNDIYVISQGSLEPALIPALKQFVPDIDVEAGRMVIDPIPGMLGDGAEEIR